MINPILHNKKKGTQGGGKFFTASETAQKLWLVNRYNGGHGVGGPMEPRGFTTWDRVDIGKMMGYDMNGVVLGNTDATETSDVRNVKKAAGALTKIVQVKQVIDGRTGKVGRLATQSAVVRRGQAHLKKTALPKPKSHVLFQSHTPGGLLKTIDQQWSHAKVKIGEVNRARTMVNRYWDKEPDKWLQGLGDPPSSKAASMHPFIKKWTAFEKQKQKMHNSRIEKAKSVALWKQGNLPAKMRHYRNHQFF